MGEIGIDRHTFLYELPLWEIQSIIRGYRCRTHTAWETMRMQAFFQLASAGCKNIRTPEDVMQLPWDKIQKEISDDEIERLKELIRQENEKAKDNPCE